MSKSQNTLTDGDHIVIIGGGPGGTACALTLQRDAIETNRSIHITVLEGKQFDGEQHYNQCVGVLSPPLPTLLEERLGIPFPHHLSRGYIRRYILHSTNEDIVLDDDQDPSIALRRIQYDAYMLEKVKERGIVVIPARAVDLEFHSDRVVVYTESAPLEAQIVVGAFGLDEGSAAMFSRQTAYHPPQALSSIVTKYHPGSDNMDAYRSCIHAFLLTHPQIEFGGITPKANHVTINIAGRNVDVELMDTFLQHPRVQSVLPNKVAGGIHDPHDLRFFKGRFPCSLARNYYGDRYVILGDAAGLVRAFKGKGVTSAVKTGINAAETIMTKGVSSQAFDGHFRTANQDISRDIPYGQGFRLLTILLSRYNLLDIVIRAARQEPALRSALFDSVSAHAPYYQVLRRSLYPRTMWAILRALLNL